MSNPQTAEEWKTVAANAEAQKKEANARNAELLAKGTELNLAKAEAVSRTQNAKTAEERAAGFAEQKAILLQQRQLKADLAGIEAEVAGYNATIANANTQAGVALTGPPNTSPNTPPATTEPNTAPTAVPPPAPLPQVAPEPPEAANPNAANGVPTTPEVTESVFDPANVDPNSDPFEQRRFELEQEADVPVADIVLTPAELEAANDPFEQRRLELEQQANRDELAREENLVPKPVDPDNDPAVRDFFEQRRQELETQANEDDDPDSDANARTKALLKETQEQASIQQYFNQTTKGDWRVRLRIAPDADYLYQDKSNALLAPLRVSDGVVFPYTPIINTSYAAKYDPYDLTHSNYRGYFYKGSQVSDVQIQATFTAQDTREAEYVLAVIQFFRSATKMFYGKDQQRGSPPPLVYLRGYGEYQFNDHACVITNFQYNLPNDVDYIAVTPNNIGLNLSNRNNQVGSSPVSTISSAIGRLSNLFNAVTGQPGVPKGAAPGTRGDLGETRQTVAGLGQATYVPTKIDMNITLLPIQTRSQVSKQFSVKEFSNGNLLKKGFW
jgi:hypothetical protein